MESVVSTINSSFVLSEYDFANLRIYDSYTVDVNKFVYTITSEDYIHVYNSLNSTFRVSVKDLFTMSYFEIINGKVQGYFAFLHEKVGNRLLMKGAFYIDGRIAVYFFDFSTNIEYKKSRLRTKAQIYLPVHMDECTIEHLNTETYLYKTSSIDT